MCRSVHECVNGGAPRRMCVGACTPDAVGGLTEGVTARAVGAVVWGSAERVGGALETRYCQ